MASGAGKWEVVKKGKKPNSGGKPQEKKSNRKALSETNTDSNREKTTIYAHALKLKIVYITHNKFLRILKHMFTFLFEIYEFKMI